MHQSAVIHPLTRETIGCRIGSGGVHALAERLERLRVLKRRVGIDLAHAGQGVAEEVVDLSIRRLADATHPVEIGRFAIGQDLGQAASEIQRVLHGVAVDRLL